MSFKGVVAEQTLELRLLKDKAPMPAIVWNRIPEAVRDNHQRHLENRQTFKNLRQESLDSWQNICVS